MIRKKWSEWRTWENWKKMASQQIEARGLTGNLEELEAQGYTVLSPEQMGDPRLIERTTKALLRISEKLTGVRPNAETGEYGHIDHPGSHAAQNMLQAFLGEDPVFEEIIQHPLTLPLIDYYLGPGCLLSALNGFVKWQDPVSHFDNLGFHADTHLYPFEPLPDPPMVFNTNWCLTNYTKDDGSLAVVPESHKLRRHPRPGEADQAVPVEAPAGSVIVFHGNLWHGAFPRVNPGLRLTVTAFYSAHYCRPQEHFPGQVSEESLARNGERFRQLLNVCDTLGIEDSRDCWAPRWDRGSGKTERQIWRETIVHHDREYRIEKDDTIVNHSAGYARYIPLDRKEKLKYKKLSNNPH
jgi:hypothetical protein